MKHATELSGVVGLGLLGTLRRKQVTGDADQDMGKH